MKKNILFICLSFFLLIATSCDSNASNPEQALWGQWAFQANNGGDLAYCWNLEFTQEGKLMTFGSSLMGQGPSDYVIIAPGRIKLTSAEESQVISYEVEEDILRLYFSEGYNEYYRTQVSAATSTITMLEEVSTPTETAIFPTNTITITPVLPTLTATPTKTIVTPTLTPTEREMSLTDEPYITPTPIRYFPLANCAASQLRVGDSAYVSYEGGTNKLRSTPDTHLSNNIIRQIQPGEVVEIIDGPKCNYGWILWKVMTTDDKTGWTPESDGEEFWLLPISTRQFCDDALPSRLVVGGMAFVEEEPDLANLVRRNPGTSSRVIGRIEPGGKMEILEGPECGETAHWWKVKSVKDGVIGWTMESRWDEYYLAPIP